MKYQLKGQEENDWCYPACLQAILRRHKIQLSQEEIARELGINGNGAREETVRLFLQKKGFQFEFYRHNETPFNEPDSLLEDSLKQGKDVLLGLSHIRGTHFCLLESFEYPTLQIRDPSNLELKQISLFDLITLMMGERFVGGFGLIYR
jgi:ABC-type bacteriocin/lantibiotic exporter with double-glycine peptidase domain